MDALLERLKKVLKVAATDKKIELKFEVNLDAPKELYNDYFSLHRVLLNLMSNALKFTKKGSVTCLVSLDRKDANRIRFEVRDTGIGIAQDNLECIFEPFKRLTHSYQGVYSGSGLGLYMVKKMLANRQGEITVTSQEGQGTEFVLTIPLVAQNRMMQRTQLSNPMSLCCR